MLSLIELFKRLLWDLLSLSLMHSTMGLKSCETSVRLELTQMCIYTHLGGEKKEQDNPWWVKQLWLVHALILQ